MNHNTILLDVMHRTLAELASSMLPLFKRPTFVETRTGNERRTLNRRRLKTGLSLELHRHSGYGPSCEATIGQHFRHKMIEALSHEACKYRFFLKKNNSEVPYLTALTEAIDGELQTLFRENKGQIKTVYLIDSVTDHILNKFQLQMLDRRQSELQNNIISFQPKRVRASMQ